MTKEAEKAAAKAAKAEKAAAKAGPVVVGGIKVSDPLVLKPVELPLVIEPADGGVWANAAQTEYAAVLNAYAYSNPAKWAVKKDVLIAQLDDLAKHPAKIVLYRGNDRVQIKNNQNIEQ
jgi:hypothetical protein